MAFDKVFIILALVSCALAMPVHPVEDEPTSSTSAKIAIEESGPTTTIAIDEATTKDEEIVATVAPVVSQVVDQEIVKRSVEEDADSEDLDTAAGTNVLRPLFVYRQQVAYRQRVKNSRRGNPRFN